MKSKFWSVALALCLCLTLLPGTARAEDKWEDWTIFDGSNLNLSNGKYYLDNDVTISGTINISGAVTLDLNGHLLQKVGNGRAITINEGAELTLNDSNPNTTKPHKFTKEQSGLWVLDETNGTELVYGGVIAGGIESSLGKSLGGCILVGSSYYSSTAKFTMNGGTIVGGQALRGGGIHSNGHFIMNGGAIKGCVCTSFDGFRPSGAALYLESGSMTANDGTVDGSVELGVTLTTDVEAKGTIFSGPFSGGNIRGGRFFVKFDPNGGTASYTEQTIKYGEKVTLPTNPSKVGYTFDGWYNGDTPWDFETPVTGPMTLTAHWTVSTYTITYELDGGINAEDNPASYTYGTGVTSFAAPSKAGYTFKGWYDNADFSGEPVTSISADAHDNITLYAKWEYNYIYIPTVPSYGVSAPKAANGTVSVSPANAVKGSTVTVTVTPDKGYTLETLTVTDKDGNALSLTDKGGGKYTFTMPGSAVTVTATFMEDNAMLNFFVDVPASAYYYDAVLWAAENGITGGTDAVHFSPDASCTRAQLVTFLWRAAGSPVVNYAMDFSDVSGDDYYAEAVRWAASLGIVGGYGDGSFGSGDTVTREQVAVMLYRFAKAQGKDVSVGEDTNILSYTDALSISDYAFPAMQWACGAGVMQGTDGSLLPQDACTRAQIVTLLFRALAEK